MTNAQRLAVRLSEIRQRLNEIAGLEGDAMTDEVRAEADRLAGEYKTAETQHRSVLIAEGEEQRAAEGAFGAGDGEAAEVRALLGPGDPPGLPERGGGRDRTRGRPGRACRGARSPDRRGERRDRDPVADAGRAGARSAGGAGGARVHHDGGLPRPDDATADPSTAVRSRHHGRARGCEWIPSRPACRSGR